ncbi:MAG: hypothetical protein N4A46_02760 [Schleiferiaceae bacterium]|nr:hypothetical protein [Schleiferiaceae bacterium]
MNRTFQINRNLITFGIPFGLFVILIFLIKSPFLNGNNSLDIAITSDLLLTIPLVYLLLIRRSPIPKTTVIPVMVIGLLVGSYFLPQQNQTYLELFKNWAFPVIELSILSFVIIKVRKAIKTYGRLKGKSPDFYVILKDVCSEILPKKLVLPFATEVAVFYYGFIQWKAKQTKSNEFTYHKKSEALSLLGGIIMIIIIETIAFHFLVAKWNVIAAWVLTGLSIYTAIQFFGFAKALTQRPIIITDKELFLRYGIMNESRICISDVESVILSKKELQKNKLTKTLSPLGEIESHNVIITLKRKYTLTGLYGIKKNYKKIGLHIDEPFEFKEKIDNALYRI